MAPEQWSVGREGYGFGVDWWAAGVILFEVLVGDVGGTNTRLQLYAVEAGAAADATSCKSIIGVSRDDDENETW